MAALLSSPLKKGDRCVFIAEFHREVNRPRRDQEIEQSLRKPELEEVGRKLDGLINAIADGLRIPGLKSKLDEIEARKRNWKPRPRQHCRPWPSSTVRRPSISGNRARLQDAGGLLKRAPAPTG